MFIVKTIFEFKGNVVHYEKHAHSRIFTIIFFMLVRSQLISKQLEQSMDPTVTADRYQYRVIVSAYRFLGNTGMVGQCVAARPNTLSLFNWGAARRHGR